MKVKIFICLLALYGYGAIAQTKKIIFPQLLSCSNTVLLTDAEFRCTSGTNIFFESNGNYERFTYADLNSNVLNTIGVTVEKLKSDELRKEQNEAAYQMARANALARDAAIKAARIRQQQLDEEAKADAQARLRASQKPATITISHTYISGGDALSGYEYGTATTTIPNN